MNLFFVTYLPQHAPLLSFNYYKLVVQNDLVRPSLILSYSDARYAYSFNALQYPSSSNFAPLDERNENE